MMEEEKKDLREPEKPETEEKNANTGLALGLALGLAIGSAVGAATGNIGLWMPIGMCLGLCVGMAFDSEKKKKYDGDDQPQA